MEKLFQKGSAPSKLRMAIYVLGTLLLMLGGAAKADPMAKFSSEYDRAEGVQNADRGELWEEQNMVGQGIAPAITAGIPNEVGQVEIPAQATAAGSNLITVVETLRANPKYEEKLGRVSGTQTNQSAADYGHDSHYDNLRERANILEQTILQGQ